MPRPNKTAKPKKEKTSKPSLPYSRRRVQTGLILTLLGFGIFILGARPDVFNLDRSRVMGFLQIAVFEVGLGLMCLGGYLSLMGLWKNQPPTIAADFGVRFVATGYVVCVVTGMADIFGLGSHPLPGIPYFGVWQGTEVMIGQALIAVGFLLLVPPRKFQSQLDIDSQEKLKK
jgi:hypothetical protein